MTSLQLYTLIQLSLVLIRFLLVPWPHGTRLGLVPELHPDLALVALEAPLVPLYKHIHIHDRV